MNREGLWLGKQRSFAARLREIPMTATSMFPRFNIPPLPGIKHPLSPQHWAGPSTLSCNLIGGRCHGSFLTHEMCLSFYFPLLLLLIHSGFLPRHPRNMEKHRSERRGVEKPRDLPRSSRPAAYQTCRPSPSSVSFLDMESSVLYTHASIIWWQRNRQHLPNQVSISLMHIPA